MSPRECGRSIVIEGQAVSNPGVMGETVLVGGVAEL